MLAKFPDVSKSKDDAVDYDGARVTFKSGVEVDSVKYVDFP